MAIGVVVAERCIGLSVSKIRGPQPCRKNESVNVLDRQIGISRNSVEIVFPMLVDICNSIARIPFLLSFCIAVVVDGKRRARLSAIITSSWHSISGSPCLNRPSLLLVISNFEQLRRPNLVNPLQWSLLSHIKSLSTATAANATFATMCATSVYVVTATMSEDTSGTRALFTSGQATNKDPA